MALYPSISSVRYAEIAGGRTQKVLTGNVDDMGREYRKRKWYAKKRNYNISYPNITFSDLRTLLQFQDDQDLSYTSFVFINDYTDTYESEYFATGDGSTVLYNLPCKSGSSITIYGDGSEYNQAADATSEGDYYIIEAGGLYSLDQITFFTAPNQGVRLTIDFTGYLAVRCRFESEIQHSRNNIYLSTNEAQVSLRGRLWDNT